VSKVILGTSNCHRSSMLMILFDWHYWILCLISKYCDLLLHCQELKSKSTKTQFLALLVIGAAHHWLYLIHKVWPRYDFVLVFYSAFRSRWNHCQVISIDMMCHKAHNVKTWQNRKYITYQNATGIMHKHFGEVQPCGSLDIIAYRSTDWQATHSPQYFLHTLK